MCINPRDQRWNNIAPMLNQQMGKCWSYVTYFGPPLDQYQKMTYANVDPSSGANVWPMNIIALGQRDLPTLVQCIQCKLAICVLITNISYKMKIILPSYKIVFIKTTQYNDSLSNILFKDVLIKTKQYYALF